MQSKTKTKTKKKQQQPIDFSTNNVRIIPTSFSSFGFWRQPSSHLQIVPRPIVFSCKLINLEWGSLQQQSQVSD